MRHDSQTLSETYLGLCCSEFLDAADTAVGGGDLADTFNKFTFDCCASKFLLKIKKKRTLATVDEARRDSKKDRTKDFHCLIISYSNTEFTSLQISATIH